MVAGRTSWRRASRATLARSGSPGGAKFINNAEPPVLPGSPNPLELGPLGLGISAMLPAFTSGKLVGGGGRVVKPPGRFDRFGIGKTVARLWLRLKRSSSGLSSVMASLWLRLTPGLPRSVGARARARFAARISSSKGSLRRRSSARAGGRDGKLKFNG